MTCQMLRHQTRAHILNVNTSAEVPPARFEVVTVWREQNGAPPLLMCEACTDMWRTTDERARQFGAGQLLLSVVSL